MIKITKASGEVVPFDPEKLRHSLTRIGTDQILIDQVVAEVTKQLTPNMKTRQIYQIAFRLLRKKSHALAGKYHLKRAIMHLGESGYPFEKYCAALLKYKNYQTSNNLIIQGHCVKHEVDIIAKQNNKTCYIECKYHHRQGIKCDVTIALYVKARFLDIAKKNQDNTSEKIEGWLITNTRFTTDAMQYGNCAELHLIGWDYPAAGNLKEIIEASGLYPITCTTSLTKAEMTRLIENNFILCKDIYEKPQILDQLRIPLHRKQTILKECQILCRGQD